MDTQSTSEAAGLEANLSLGKPQFWLGGFGYDAGNWRVQRHPRYAADVNGDGRDDIVGFGNAGVWVALSNGTSLEPPRLWVDDYGYEVPAGDWRVELHPRVLADVNGDGKDDVVGFADEGIYVALSTGTAFEEPQFWLDNFSYIAGNWRVSRHPRFVTDVDGDGRADVVGFGYRGVWLSLSTGSGFPWPTLSVSDFGYNDGWRVQDHPRMLADVDGDGRPDIVGFGEDGTYVSLWNGRSFGRAELWVEDYGSAQGWRVGSNPRFMADVDGDQRADIVGFGEDGVYVSLSTGLTFTEPELWVPHYGHADEGWRADEHPRFVRDLDADGRADIVGFGNKGVYVSYSTGSSFTAPKLAIDGYGFDTDWRVERHPRLLARMNHDDKVDVVGFGYAGIYVSVAD